MLRASIAAESIGIPSVSIVCDGFANQANATARGLGYDSLPLAVTVGHVDAQSAEVMRLNFIESTIDRIVEGLLNDTPDVSDGNTEPAALDIVSTGTIDEINALFVEQGRSDGHAVIPPTRDRVERFLDGSGHDPWKTLGVAASSGRDMTIWSIAVNAVMAGCRSEHLPVLLALEIEVQEALFDHARIEARTFERFIGEWSNLTAGRRTLVDLVAQGGLPPVFAETDDPYRLVPIVTRPERILSAVAGNPNRVTLTPSATTAPTVGRPPTQSTTHQLPTSYATSVHPARPTTDQSVSAMECSETRCPERVAALLLPKQTEYPGKPLAVATSNSGYITAPRCRPNHQSDDL